MCRSVLFGTLVLAAHFVGPSASFAQRAQAIAQPNAGSVPTITPIKHLVIIFDENNSFDHYFGTYPHAANPSGEPPFSRPCRHAHGQWPYGRANHRESEFRRAFPPRSFASFDV
jgi:phospholipase C